VHGSALWILTGKSRITGYLWNTDFNILWFGTH